MQPRNVLFISFFAVLSASFSTTAVHAQSVALSVEFGTKQTGDGLCVGDGVCECSPQSTTAPGINVLFQTSADQNTLILTFSLSDLKNNEPDQVANFTNSTGSYIFDVAYSLSDPMFANLNLPQNAQITPNSNSTVVINGDVVTDYITLYYGD
jgi:hypothetical protein